MSTRPGDSIIESPQEQEEPRHVRLRQMADSLKREEVDPNAAGRETRTAARSSLPTQRQNVEAGILGAQREQQVQQSSAQLDALLQVLPQASANFSELVAGISPLTGYREIYEIASKTSPGEVGEIFTRLAAGDFEGSNELFAEIASRSETAVRQQGLRAAALGGVVQGLGGGIASTLELPAEAIEALPEEFRRRTNLDDLSQGIFWLTDDMRDDFRRFAERQDQLAAAFGIQQEDITGAKVVGGFVGFAPLLYGGFKAAEIFPFARGAGRTPFMFRDLTAGTILGLSTTEGDLKARLGAAAAEAAFFGAWSLAFAGLGLPIKAYRNRRWLQKMEKAEMERFVQEMNQRYNPNTGMIDLDGLDGTTGRALFEVLSEEQAISGSSEARRVVSRTSTEEALVPALMDLAEGQASHGIIRGVKNPDELVPRLQESFPHLNFEVAQGPRQVNVIFGRGKLGDDALKAFQNEGRFRGQRLLVAGQEMEYLGKGPIEGRLQVRRIDSGREVEGGVPEHIVTDLPYGVRGRPSKQLQELVDQFADQFMTRIEQVVKNRSHITEEEAIQAAREGRLAELGLTTRSRRDAPIERAIGSPEALGIQQPPIPPEQLAKVIAEEGFETFHPVRPSDPATFRDVVRGFAERQGLLEQTSTLADDLTVEARTVQHKQFGDQRMFIFRNAEGEEVVRIGGEPREGGRVMEHMVASAPDRSEPISPGRLRAILGRVAEESPNTQVFRGNRTAGARGTGRRFEFTRDDLIRRELTPESKEILGALQQEAATAVRRRMWGFIPKEERRILEELQDQVIRTLEDKGPSLEREAALAGFNVRRLRGGDVELREVNSGLGTTFTNEQAAREALQGVERRLSNDVGRSIYPRMADEVPFTSHLPEADDFFITSQSEAGQVIERLVDNPKWRNLGAWTQQFEERTGIPVHSQIFSRLDEAQQSMSRDAEPWLQRVLATWKDFSREERAALDPFFQEIAGRELSQAQMVGIGQRLGLNGKQVRAAIQALELERAMFAETGLPQFRYLDNHFARIRPQTAAGEELPQRIADLMDDELPQQAQQFWQKVRTGELAQREVDPLLIQMKYVRSVFWDKHLSGPWERARAFLGRDPSNPFNIDDLDPTQRNRLLNTFVNREGVKNAREVLMEYTGRARGFPAEGERATNRFLTRLVDKLELDIPEPLIREATDTMMSIMYGAAMAGRARMTARNLSQNLWYSFMRLDGGYGGEALRAAMSRQGWRMATEADALRPQQRGVFAGGATFEGHLAAWPEREGAGKAATTVARRLGEVGEGARKLSSTGMIPFGSADDFNRAWGFHWQRLHTQDYLRRFKQGEISEKEFIDEGLRGHTATTKREFARRADLMGEEEALNYIGKQHADEAHFIYSRQSQPMWMQGDVGKFGGMFGTFSMWSKDYLWHTLAKNMNPKQAAGMFAKGASMGAAIYLISEEMGLDLNNWISPLSAITFTGGPATDIVLGVKDIVDNSTFNPEAIPTAANRLFRDQLRLSYPFQGLQHDLQQVNQMPEGLDKQVLSLILGRPESIAEVDFWNDVMLPHESRTVTPKDQVLQALDLLPPK